MYPDNCVSVQLSTESVLDRQVLGYYKSLNGTDVQARLDAIHLLLTSIGVNSRQPDVKENPNYAEPIKTSVEIGRFTFITDPKKRVRLTERCPRCHMPVVSQQLYTLGEMAAMIRALDERRFENWDHNNGNYNSITSYCPTLRERKEHNLYGERLEEISDSDT